MSNSKLIIYFIKEKGKNRYYDSFNFLDKTYKIQKKDLIIDIEDKYFNIEKEKRIFDIKIFPAEPLSTIINYKINIFYGINKAYFFLNVDNYYLIEYNYIENQKIFYKDIELKNYDGNGLVKRLVLINCPNILNISDITLTFFNKTILKNNKNFNSFEITDCDYSNSFFGIRPIKIEEKFNLINNMKEQKQNLENLYTSLKVMIEKNIKDKNEYINLFKNYDIKEYILNFSQKKIILEEEFKSNEDYYLMYLYWIWYTIKNSYLREKYKCKISIFDLFNAVNKIYNEYLNDKDLLVYEKIILLYSQVSFLLEKNDIEGYKSAKLRVIKRKDFKDNSIYKLSFDFLKEFISKLNEKSYLFLPLLMIDCGNYYYNEDNECIYGFNRESCEVVKNHLNELIPNIFFEYSEKIDETKEESGFNYKGFRIIFLNRCAIYKDSEKDPVIDTYKNDDEKKLFKHFGVLASKTLMHESFCHNKILFDKKHRIVSPSKFYNTEKKLVKMVSVSFHAKNEINTKNIEYFKSLNERKTGESGKFFEYFFGKYENMLIIDLIFKIKYIGNLLDYVDYFVKENIDELKKYIINKYEIMKYETVKYEDNSNLSLEDENKKMEKFISELKEKNKIINKEEKIEEKKDENNEKIFESKKNIIFLEESQKNDEIDEQKNIEEKEEEEDSLPFFKVLHIS